MSRHKEKVYLFFIMQKGRSELLEVFRKRDEAEKYMYKTAKTYNSIITKRSSNMLKITGYNIWFWIEPRYVK